MKLHYHKSLLISIDLLSAILSLIDDEEKSKTAKGVEEILATNEEIISSLTVQEKDEFEAIPQQIKCRK